MLWEENFNDTKNIFQYLLQKPYQIISSELEWI